jgi:Icc-related predicted phosphoesterase
MGSGARDAASAAASADPAAVAASRRAAGVKVCFSSDLHGNVDHLEKVLAKAVETDCDAIVLGGDLAPRGNGHGYHELGQLRDYLPHLPNGKPDWACEEALAYMQEGFERQGEWFETECIPRLAACAVPSVCMFGNSDWAGLMPRCHAAAAPTGGHVRFVEGEGDFFTLRKRRSSADGDGGGGGGEARAMACSLVPICAHKKKDWERCDTRTLAHTLARRPFMDPEGFGSGADGTGAVRVAIPLTDAHAEAHSIEASLERLIRRAPGGVAPPFWFIHAPPRDTVGDLCDGKEHVGSIAVLEAIKRRGPRATLHGHIHESVRNHGGRFKEKVVGEGGGETLVVSSGNDFKLEHPFAVVMDTADPDGATRVECTGG